MESSRLELVRERLGKATALVGTCAAVTVPFVWLLPTLQYQAIDAWHVRSFVAYLENAHAASLATILLSLYVLALVVRHIAFVCASAVEVSSRFQQADDELVVADRTSPPGSHVWPLVSIVVPAYNEGVVIRQSIRSLLALDYPFFEVLVIDDGSKDDTYSAAREMAATDRRVQVVRKINGGKASALNLGIARAKGSLILNVDADSRLDAGSLRACVRHFLDPNVGAVAGNIKVANRDNLLCRLQAIEYIQGLALERLAQGAVKAVSVIGGPLGVFRRSALIDAGGYDHDTFAEDRDLTLKLLAAGWTIPYEPGAKAWAESPSKVLDLMSQRYRWSRGTVQAVFKHRKSLLAPRQQPLLFVTLWYMALDTFLVPTVSLAMACFFAYVVTTTGGHEFFLLWILLAALFDVAVTAYCLILDEEDIHLLPASLALRPYAILTDVIKLLATVEELAQADMNWGKLTREGKI